MAINNKLDNDKNRKEARKKSFKRWTIAAIAAFNLSALGQQIHHNVIHAPDRLLEAVEAGDIQRADKFAERILSENDMLELLQKAIADDNSIAIKVLFETKRSYYDTTMQEKFADEYLSQQVFHDHADTLIPLVIENGNLEIFEYLISDIRDRLSNEEIEVLTHKILIAVIEDGKVDEAIKLSKLVAYENSDFHGNIYHQIAHSILELDEIQPRHIDYIIETFTEIRGAYKESIIEGLVEKGLIEEAAHIIKKMEYSSYFSETYWRSVVENNGLNTMIEAALYLELSDDFDLIKAAEHIAKYASEDIARDFIEHFSVNNERYLSWLLISSISDGDQDLAITASNAMIEQFGEDMFVSHVRYRISDGDSTANFLYNVVRSHRLDLSDSAKEEIVTLFSGTLDDNLRIIWDLNDAAERAPLSRFETTPRP